MSLSVVLDDLERVFERQRKKELFINDPIALFREYVGKVYVVSKRALKEEYRKRYYSLPRLR